MASRKETLLECVARAEQARNHYRRLARASEGIDKRTTFEHKADALNSFSHGLFSILDAPASSLNEDEVIE